VDSIVSVPETAAKPLDVLLIDDDPDIPVLISSFLEERGAPFKLDWVDNLTAGIAHFQKKKPDVVLLDLHLPDSQGFETFTTFKSKISSAPVVVMTSLDDQNCALEALKNGAQDYLVKGEVDGKRLSLVLHYAIVRHANANNTLAASMMDESTGFYNRKGLVMMISQQLKSSQRTGGGLTLLLSQINDLNRIRQMYGEEEAAQAARMAAQILKESFRDSDPISRVAPDRFVVIPSDYTHYFPKTIARRLDKNPHYHEAQFNHYKLTLGLASLRISCDPMPSAEAVLEQIDKAFDSKPSA
jgi:diguanylate cyclase (GGDEF)-like protein